MSPVRDTQGAPDCQSCAGTGKAWAGPVVAGFNEIKRPGRHIPCPACGGSGEAVCRPDPTHWSFLLGLQDYGRGNNECPHFAGSNAAYQWHAGWAAAEGDALCSDERAEAAFERAYC
jgi:hypothetical protein